MNRPLSHALFSCLAALILAVSAAAQGNGVVPVPLTPAEEGLSVADLGERSGASFFVPCSAIDERGFIARYDAMSGYLAGRVDLPSLPGKILFSRDGSRGFVLLDSDQIGVFDPIEERWLYLFSTGSGLLDMVLTPDGSKLIALCTERDSLDDDVQVKGALWICNVADIGSMTTGLEIERRPVAIDFVRNGGTGRMLAVSENSRSLYIRTDGPYISVYNLQSGAMRPIKLGNQSCSPCTVMDIQVSDSCLTALLSKSDGFGYLCIMNTQTYIEEYVPLGWAPTIFSLFKRDGRPMAVILHCSENGSAHFLKLLDLYTGTVSKTIASNLFEGVRDVDVNGIRDVGAVLYVRGGEAAQYGLVGFFDRETLEWRREVVTKVPVDPGTRLFLARSPLINQCYVLTRSGVLTVIDLDIYRKVGDPIDLNGEIATLPSELF